MTVRQYIQFATDFVIVSLLYYRKQAISTILLMGIFGTIIILGTQNRLTQLVSTIGVLLLSSDYGVLKWIYRPLYDWIDRPKKQLWPEQAIEFALELIKVNYHAKRYENVGNPGMAIIEADGRDLAVDSTTTYEHLTEGMVFQIYFEDIITYEEKELPAPRRLGLARIREVTDSVSWLTVTEWNQEHPAQERAIQRGRLNGLNSYVKAKMSKEVQNSDESELEEALRTVRTIHHNRERMTT